MMHMPAALKQLLAATPQWLPIALDYPQEAIQVLLRTSGAQFEVTGNNVIAALRPLTVALGLDASMISAVDGVSGAGLEFVDRALRRPIGTLRLRPPQFCSAAGRCIGLFEVQGGTQHCSGLTRKVWDSWMYQRAARKKTGPDSLALASAAVEQSLIFYLCPRPVFLVSVDDGQHSNIFPMDLVGPIAPDRFTLALRNTSPSVETIKATRKVALSSIAAADHRIAYQLGAHHKRITIEPDTLPFKMSASREFRIPIPVTALRVREVEIHDFREVGSHTFFVGQVVSDDAVRNAPQLFHTCGAHQQLRERDGRSFKFP